MHLRRSWAAGAAALVLTLAAAEGATPEKDPYSLYRVTELSFSALKLGLSSRVLDLQADGVNRVWVATDRGVAAVEGSNLAQFFPLTTLDGLLANSVAAVAFGPLENDQENFFLGFNGSANGAQYGRILADTGLSPKPPAIFPISTVPNENVIFGLSTDGASNLWAATLGGLTWWNLGGNVPVRHVPETVRPGDRVNLVAVDPWAATQPHVVFADVTDGNLYVLPGGAIPERDFENLTDVRGLAFDASRGLWVAAGNRIYRFAQGDPSTPYQGEPEPPGGLLFDPDTSLRQIRSIAVDPFNPEGTIVWVGTDSGAYFQRYDSATGLAEDGWTLANTDSTDSDVQVYVDPSGNLWLGSDFGVRSLQSRLLTLSGSRFVGYDAQATVTLLDVNLTPDSPDPLIFVVKSGTDTPDLTLTGKRQPDGTYSATFGFAPETVPGQSLGVASSAKDATFEVVYTYQLGEQTRELPRPAFTWANVVKFDDDLWIGNPCFIKSLGMK